MQTQIRIVSEPKVIESIMRPRIMEILHENISKINLGELVLNKLIVQHAFETSWHCDALTNMKITYCKIEKLDIISINKIHCRFPLQTEKTFIVDVKSVYYGDGTVEITNLKETIRAINNLFCERCGNETDECSCVHENIQPIQEQSSTSRGSISLNTLDINYNLDQDLDPEIFDLTDSFWESPTEKYNSSLPKIDFDKFIPVIKGVSQTFKIKYQDAENIARKIIASNPEISEGVLASEMLKHTA